MAKETRQIGVMKAIGARTTKITSIYLTIVLVFGLTATLLALPVGFLAGKAYAGFVASMLNFELFNQQISHGVLLFQFAIGTVLPVLVAFVPIYRASRISVQEALNDYGVINSNSLKSAQSKSKFKQLLLSNSTQLAIRNTFRRKGRLILTLITLVLGGAVFITAFNIRRSLKETVNSRFTNQRYDIQAFIAKGIADTDFSSALDSLPFIAGYETWGYGRATQLTSGSTESELMDLKLVPLKTTLFVPELISGIWLSGRTDEIVVNHMFLAKYPDTKLGNVITLKANGKQKSFKVVGIIRELFAPVTVYASKSVLAEWSQMQGKTNSVLIAFNTSENIGVNTVKLEQWFAAKKYPISLVYRKDEYKERVVDHLVVITSMLIMVSLLLIIVGGLGLITTMGINIVERMRELAILRSIGVTNLKLYKLIITEGFIVGLLSWGIATVVSVPLSYYLGNKFFNIFFETTLNFDVSFTGMFVWLGIIVLFSTVAVLVPARNAVKQSIAEGLNYE